MNLGQKLRSSEKKSQKHYITFLLDKSKFLQESVSSITDSIVISKSNFEELGHIMTHEHIKIG